MTIVVLLAVAGVLVLAAWPLAVRWRRSRPKRLDQPVTAHDPAPEPRRAGEPVPGSEPYRREHGKP
jgi:hypothetical protein